MAQHGADGVEGGSVAQEASGQRVAQEMGPTGRSLHARPFDGAPDHVTQAAGTQRSDGGTRGEKHVVRGHGRTLGLEILKNRVAGVLGQRQTHDTSTLAHDTEPSLSPLKILESEADNFVTPQTEPRQQQHHGSIASRHAAGAIASRNDALHLRVGEIAGQAGQPPRRHSGDRLDEVWRAPSMRYQVAQEATDDGGDATGRCRCVSLDVLEHELSDAHGLEAGGLLAYDPEQRLDYRQRVADRRFRQVSVMPHPRTILGNQ